MVMLLNTHANKLLCCVPLRRTFCGLEEDEQLRFRVDELAPVCVEPRPLAQPERW